MKQEKPKVYLSGGLKSNWQETIINKLSSNFEFYNPYEHGLSDPEKYTVWDTYHVQKCDIVFAYMEKSNDSGYGLTLEIGLAKSLNKLIILVDERSENDPEFRKKFKIVQETANVVFDNLLGGIKFLERFNPTI